ncbi:tRNA (adenosine(37)-N6)-dimethylallyltransferase MiaA [Pseudovibrio exalbescens]|uniref:tRNA (adenosine(37)-N6)-dimethylallyltransferase MiaA n=1 Tax=Pseudovibrio exalbescens TaxID=197461 RepID=UPI001EEF650B|nr:tRNA (adenosine(37)-N6)-dimethylallyltransferase MiaA [Pseudovibrio exalbescens]
MSVTTKDMDSSQVNNDDVERRPAAVLIAGPTASGKTSLAIDVARDLNTCIINADSMQIYKELHILSARPSKEEESRAPHKLFGYVSLVEPYSVMRWLSDFEKCFRQAQTEGKPVVVVGGTGLYFKALTEGFSHLPDIPEDVRCRWREAGLQQPSEILHERLAEVDPIVAARLEPGDTQRIVRALEVIEGTGQSLAYWQQNRTPALVPFEQTIGVVLDPPRAALYERIHQRFDAMMDSGAMEEAIAVHERQFDPSLTGMKAIGLRQLISAHLGEESVEGAIEKAKTETRRYAKRQTTFFRGQLATWQRINPLNEAEVTTFRQQVRQRFL